MWGSFFYWMILVRDFISGLYSKDFEYYEIINSNNRMPLQIYNNLLLKFIFGTLHARKQIDMNDKSPEEVKKTFNEPDP